MNHDRSNQMMSPNPFVMRTRRRHSHSPSWGPLQRAAGTPADTPEAMFEARLRAYGEWREYLPHGLSLADYEPYRFGWLRDLAITSATKPLALVLTPAEATQAAEAAADAAFVGTSRLLSQYEPD